MKKLVLASNNAKKMKELNALLAPRLGKQAVERLGDGPEAKYQPHAVDAVAEARHGEPVDHPEQRAGATFVGRRTGRQRRCVVEARGRVEPEQHHAAGNLGHPRIGAAGFGERRAGQGAYALIATYDRDAQLAGEIAVPMSRLDLQGERLVLSSPAGDPPDGETRRWQM